jgi:hypothetical protein
MKRILVFIIVAAISYYYTQYERKEEQTQLVEAGANEIEQLLSDQSNAETWEEIDSANKRLEEFNKKSNDDMEQFFNAPHIKNAKGDIGKYRDLLREEMTIIGAIEPRRLSIEEYAKKLESSEMEVYANENPDEYFKETLGFCEKIKQQVTGTGRHQEIGEIRVEMLRDESFFESVFLGQLGHSPTIIALDKMMGTRKTVSDSWQQTYKESECELLLLSVQEET